MHSHDLSHWSHEHAFDPGNVLGERGAWRVAILTAAMMVAELAAGWWFHSMALLADGWHMATHALALGLAAAAYALARHWSRDERFAFGTWKLEILASYSSALLLLVVAALLAVESAARLWQPVIIRYQEALAIAVLGLVVNVVSAWMLGSPGHAHEAGHSHGHDSPDPDHGPEAGHAAHRHHSHAHPDLNLRSAYAHVVTDALTSVLAIVALSGGLLWGWSWLDPAMGLVGAAVIAAWAVGLLRDSGKVLLDREMDHPVVAWTRSTLESDGDARVADLHLWRVGRDRFACVACLVADNPLAPDAYRLRLLANPALVHVTVEVNACAGHSSR